MNLSCKYRSIFGYPRDCGEPTTHGRTHCPCHRADELKRLSQQKVSAREAYEAAEKTFDVYFHEGSGL